MSIEVGDGSALVLGLHDDRRESAADHPARTSLVFQHRQPGIEAPWVDMSGGRLDWHLPVMVNGKPTAVFAGEVDECVDGVLLRFSAPADPSYHEYLAHVAVRMGRRIWMTHPQPIRPRMTVWVAWLHGLPEDHAFMSPASSYGSTAPESM